MQIILRTSFVHPPPLSASSCIHHSSDGTLAGHDTRPASWFWSATFWSNSKTEYRSGLTRKNEAVLVWPFFLGSGTVTLPVSLGK